MKKSVVIFGQKVKLIPVKNLYKQKAEFGYYNYEDKNIYYDPDLSKKALEETIRHEMGHALFDRTGLRQNEILSAHEESIVEQFAIMFSENKI